MFEYQVLKKKRNKEMLSLLNESGFLKEFKDKSVLLKDFTFYEFDLSEIKMPSVQEIQKMTTQLLTQIEAFGWASNGVRHDDYKGVSLTYNSEYIDTSESKYHQTLGSLKLKQSFSRHNGHDHQNLADTYYDSLTFRKIDPLIFEHFKGIFDAISCAVSRSRIGILYPENFEPDANKGANWHKDEYPYDLLRINIPVFTSSEHVLQIDGADEYGNSLKKEIHLQSGKAYLWNTRIPHRIFTPLKTGAPRVHIVIGILPYLNYDMVNDNFKQNIHYGKNLHDYVSSRSWMKPD